MPNLFFICPPMKNTDLEAYGFEETADGPKKLTPQEILDRQADVFLIANGFKKLVLPKETSQEDPTLVRVHGLHPEKHFTPAPQECLEVTEVIRVARDRFKVTACQLFDGEIDPETAEF